MCLVRMTDASYALAVAGLIRATSQPWALDLRDNDFEAEKKRAVLNSILSSTSLTSLNKLSHGESARSLQRDRHDSNQADLSTLSTVA